MKSPAAVLGVLIAGVALAGPATAQSVPLPQPAPQRDAQSSTQAKPGGPIALAPGQRSAAGTQHAQRTPAPRPPVKVRPGESMAVNNDQRAVVDRISAYLSSIRTLSGDFVQVGPDGRKSEGAFHMQKPGRIRFDYNPPNPLELIADGSSVVVRDRKLATQDVYPLSQTPLRFLLADRIDLMRDTNLIGVYSDDVFVTVVIEERQALVGTHRLMLMFGADDYELRQWTVTDPQGHDTTVAVYNLDPKSRPDPRMFRIDYTRMLQ